MRVAIVADDLTGAADTAVEFTAPGRRVQVALGVPFGSGADVLSVDIDSREVAPADAARRVATAVRSLASEAPGLWYKKLDSTLRGNVAAELTAFAASTGCSLLLVAPAFPAQGRGYIDGALWSDEPLAGRDGTVLHLPTILAEADRKVESFSLRQVREATAAMRARLRAMPRGAIVVADAVADSDLDSIVAAAAASGRRVAYAGSAGLAAALGRSHGADIHDAPTLDGPSRALLIVGSLHPIARRQLALAANQIGLPFVWPGDVASLASLSFDPDGAAVFHCHNALILATLEAVADNPRDLTARFAMAAARLITEMGIRRVFCTGGEVARAVSDRLGIHRFSVQGRVQEGMPALRAEDGRPGLVMVTKAGGFGSDDSLLHACRYLVGMDRTRR
jgi:D-threonate/D-erythronate kinase